MNILFAGSSQFSIPSLEACVQSGTVVAVLTRSDKPAGRKLVLRPTPVKLYAQEKGIPVIDTEVLRAECRDTIAKYSPDCMICVAYGKMFGEKFLALFPKGTVNVHPSLLPRYRGANPILSTLLSYDTHTGVTLQKMVQEMDAGDIVLQSKRKMLPEYGYEQLESVLAHDAAALITKLFTEYEQYYANAAPQVNEQAVYTLKYTSRYGYLLWCESAKQIVHLTQAFSFPLSGVKVHLHEKLVKIWKARVVSNEIIEKETGMLSREKAMPGTVLGIHTKYGIIVNTVCDCLAIEELQLEHKRKMHWKDFVQGQKHLVGSIFR